MASVARKILIAMDGSKYSDQAFDWYVKTFYRENDFLCIVYCTEHGTLLSAPVPCNDPSFISKLASDEDGEIVKLLNSFKEKLMNAKEEHANLKGSVQRLSLSGRKPGPLILKQAKEQAVDMIITGGRGQSTLRTSLVGSVCTYIMQNSGVPVLLVPLQEDKD